MSFRAATRLSRQLRSAFRGSTAAAVQQDSGSLASQQVLAEVLLSKERLALASSTLLDLACAGHLGKNELECWSGSSGLSDFRNLLLTSRLRSCNREGTGTCGYLCC